MLEALELDCGTNLNVSTREMRRLVAAGFLAGIGAEYLREFRNALAHGDIRKPTPQDWGEKSTYVANDDPAIRQFHANIRLTLLLIQILARSALEETDTLSAWLAESQPATLVLTQLHCTPPVWLEYTDGLPLDGAPLFIEEC